MTPQTISTLIDIAEDCGVSRFNLTVLDDGVLFHSAGLCADEIECARYMLVKALAGAMPQRHPMETIAAYAVPCDTKGRHWKLRRRIGYLPPGTVMPLASLHDLLF